jgi:hypothetical protein
MWGILLVCLLGLTASLAQEITLAVAPTLLTPTNNQVGIKWAGVLNASEYDFVAIYSPSTSGLENELGWFLTSEVDSQFASGSGSTVLPLINMRTDFVLRFWKAYDGKPNGDGNSTRRAPFPTTNNTAFALEATSQIIAFENPNTANQGHLALTTNETEMRIMWVSGDESAPSVMYGPSPNELTELVWGTTTTYAITDMCARPANTTPNWRDPGYIHDAIMINLQPSSLYYYKFGDNYTGWSPVYSFYSAPTTGPQSEAYVIAYGDLGVSTPYSMAHEQQLPSSKTIQYAVDTVTSPSELSGSTASNIPWLALHVGDISYARGYAFLWEYFFNLIEPLATQVPYMVCIGNHEYDYLGQEFSPAGYGYGNDSGGECGVPYLKRFSMPQMQGAQEDLWYSFNYGPIHFTIMSTEHNFTVGSPQYNFLVQDLASVDRSVTPFVIFSGHRPMYSSMGDWPPVRDILEPVVVKYGVNLCLWGHVHNYERTCGIVNGVCAETDDDAPVHVVIGMAGNTYNLAWEGGFPEGGEEVEPEWSIFRSITYGYTRFYANSTHLHMEFLTDQRNEVHDELWLHAN